MMTAPPLFDTGLARRRLARAHRAGYADFLLRRVVDDLDDRLGAVLRTFTEAVDLGTPASLAAERLRASGRVGHVTRLAPRAEAGAVLADPEALPLAPARFDLAVSLLALQHVNDLPGALAQLRRALRPDGLFIGCLLGGRTLTELRQVFGQAESEVEGGVSPRVAPFAEVREMGSLLQRAGFALPVTDVETVTVRYRDPFALMHDLRAMGLTNVLVDRRRTPLRRDTLLRAAALYAERFADPDGRLRASFEILWLSGWAPHESQQKPLKPGTAQTRLAEALGTTERKTEGQES
ncbi:MULTISPECIES: methyltransferase domain-containing protein [unclassified Methylobacterium]|uniref:methyltransferase domain-containing protein n=1 Tax=unclassified Methylobacterium TaxID=2615210 RepID=UPI0006FA3FA4|nr:MULTISPECIES: methyltransferase domain-containing protein [unclassified Methylobacterium]KQO68236.1 SAM-dependent methyltransferase [Methylobacterium sp. Leaf89]KQO70129.1 SAM-dependent methyltransferase [Methylobacterium sp. Leaf88]